MQLTTPFYSPIKLTQPSALRQQAAVSGFGNKPDEEKADPELLVGARNQAQTDAENAAKATNLDIVLVAAGTALAPLLHGLAHVNWPIAIVGGVISTGVALLKLNKDMGRYSIAKTVESLSNEWLKKHAPDQAQSPDTDRNT